MKNKLLVYILFFLSYGCEKNNSIYGGKEFYQMVDSKKGVYSIRNNHPIKFPLLKKSNQFYSAIKIMEDEFNYFFLFNTTNKPKSFRCEDGQPKMIQEAQDNKGVWRPIEYWRLSTCGMSHQTCSIEPNEYTFYKIRKYSGDFETKLRVKYRIDDVINYSPEFKGIINKKQFNIPSTNIREDQFLN